MYTYEALCQVQLASFEEVPVLPVDVLMVSLSQQQISVCGMKQVMCIMILKDEASIS
jgi:hypothetical protein